MAFIRCPLCPFQSNGLTSMVLVSVTHNLTFQSKHNLKMDFRFKDLCSFFEAFSRISRGSEKGSYLRNFIQQCKDNFASSNKNKDDCSVSFYGLARLILPSLDRDRGPYGMKEYKFARVIIKMLCLPSKSPDAMQLANFRTSATMSVKDFADAAYYVLRKYFANSSDVTVEQIHKHLDAIADRNANNDPREYLYI